MFLYSIEEEKRLKEHNSGLVESTKNRRPCILFYKEEYSNLPSAREKRKISEKFIRL